MTTNEKTYEKWWEDKWKKSIPSSHIDILDTFRYGPLSKSIIKFLNRYLEKGDGKKILELGCANSRWLIYFKKNLGYKIYGIDRSEVGCELARENLKKENIKGLILCEDLFETSLDTNFFDVVYSMGLIEHFNNPTEIINKHIYFLKNVGKLILIIPNFQKKSLRYFIAKLIGKEKELLASHNIELMSITSMKSYFEKIDGFRIEYLEYHGLINISLFDFSKFRNNRIFYLINILNIVLGYPTLYLKSKHFSPYIIIIGVKI